VSETLDAAPTEAPDTSPADDLRSAIGAAFDEHDAPETDRDDRGRFASNEPQQPSAPDTEPTQGIAAEPAEPDAPAIDPPASLSADDLSRWATLPREHQEWVAAREAKAQETARSLEPVQSVLKQYEPLYAARGIPAPQAMAQLFEAQRMLESPRAAEAIAVLARQYGVDLSQFGSGATNQPNDAVTALMQEVQQLKAEVAQSRQAAVQSASDSIDTTIREFAANPANRHFPTVRSYMGALMTADPALDMATAYQMACRAHPTVSKALSSEAEKASMAAKTKAANEARGKAVSVRGSLPSTGAVAVPDSVRGTLNAAWDGQLH